MAKALRGPRCRLVEAMPEKSVFKIRKGSRGVLLHELRPSRLPSLTKKPCESVPKTLRGAGPLFRSFGACSLTFRKTPRDPFLVLCEI